MDKPSAIDMNTQPVPGWWKPRTNSPRSVSSDMTHSSDFSVHTGVSHPRSPLGHSDSPQSHFIKPVPPTYVTEYESSFVPPPPEAYPVSPKRHGSPFDFSKYRNLAGNPWSFAEQELKGLAGLGFEPELISQAIPQVHDRKLHDAIERLYEKLVALKDGDLEELRSFSFEQRREILEKCKHVIKNIEFIKRKEK